MLRDENSKSVDRAIPESKCGPLSSALKRAFSHRGTEHEHCGSDHLVVRPKKLWHDEVHWEKAIADRVGASLERADLITSKRNLGYHLGEYERTENLYALK